MRPLVIIIGVVFLAVNLNVTPGTLASDVIDFDELNKKRQEALERTRQQTADQTTPERAGEDSPPDHLTQSGSMLRAAYNGDVDAQEALGQAHLHGLGAPKNSIRAYMWFNLAAAQGNDESARERDMLANSMSKGQIATAEQLSTELWEKMSLAEVMGWSYEWWEIYLTKLVLQR